MNNRLFLLFDVFFMSRDEQRNCKSNTTNSDLTEPSDSKLGCIKFKSKGEFTTWEFRSCPWNVTVFS